MPTYVCVCVYVTTCVFTCVRVDMCMCASVHVCTGACQTFGLCLTTCRDDWLTYETSRKPSRSVYSCFRRRCGSGLKTAGCLCKDIPSNVNRSKRTDGTINESTAPWNEFWKIQTPMRKATWIESYGTLIDQFWLNFARASSAIASAMKTDL